MNEQLRFSNRGKTPGPPANISRVSFWGAPPGIAQSIGSGPLSYSHVVHRGAQRCRERGEEYRLEAHKPPVISRFREPSRDGRHHLTVLPVGNQQTQDQAMVMVTGGPGQWQHMTTEAP